MYAITKRNDRLSLNTPPQSISQVLELFNFKGLRENVSEVVRAFDIFVSDISLFSNEVITNVNVLGLFVLSGTVLG